MSIKSTEKWNVPEQMAAPKVRPAFVRENDTPDWCHLCGRRSYPQVFMRSCENAEHPNVWQVGADQRTYAQDTLLRACKLCLQQALRVLEGQEPDQLFEVLKADRGSGAEQEDRRRGAPSLGDLVYIIQSGLAGPVKIGVTHDLKRRLAQLQTSHPHPLRLLASFVGGFETEARLHKRFAKHQMQGEWFDHVPVLEWLRVATA